MNSVRRIFKIGNGPSSSHSMGPRRAAELFARRLEDRAVRVEVHLYGSLAATGKGHLTDQAISAGLQGRDVKVISRAAEELPMHPNGMEFRAIDASGNAFDTWRVYSIGGGDLLDDHGPVDAQSLPQYPAGSMREIQDWCDRSAMDFWAYAPSFEGEELWAYLADVWRTMRESIVRGLSSKEETLPGSLKLRRRAADMQVCANERVGFWRDLNLLSSYALAVAEENGAGGQIVTAPTCGSAGVLPSVLYYWWKHNNVKTDDVLKAISTAGLFGSIVAKRASISGAQVGCQGEIGTACAMAAAAAAQMLGGTRDQIEYAAEMGMEHCLGLTCDPINGLVQVPCIERNAFAAMRSVDCAAYALSTDGKHLVSFDDVVDVMRITGLDLQSKYRETATGGLAAIMRDRIGM